jgi:hypothetical protein
MRTKTAAQPAMFHGLTVGRSAGAAMVESVMRGLFLGGMV